MFTFTVRSFGQEQAITVNAEQVRAMVELLQTLCHETSLLSAYKNPTREDLRQDVQQLVITKEDASKILASICPTLV